MGENLNPLSGNTEGLIPGSVEVVGKVVVVVVVVLVVGIRLLQHLEAQKRRAVGPSSRGGSEEGQIHAC